MSINIKWMALGMLLLASVCCKAQHEYYGTTGFINDGFFFKTDSLGKNLKHLYDFDLKSGVDGRGSLIQASNGNIYGITSRDTNSFKGVLFEYNPILDSFTVKLHLPHTCYYGLVQGSDGNLYYAESSSAGYLMRYNIDSNKLTQLNYIPYNETPVGQLVEMNGKLYGVCAFGGGMYKQGRIYEYNLTTHVLTYLYNFSTFAGGQSQAGLISGNNGLLYGTTRTDSINGNLNGTLYSFNPVTKAYKYLLTSPDSIGSITILNLGANNKIYGTATNGTDSMGNHWGCIYEYDPATNHIRITHNFGFQHPNQYPITGQKAAFGGLLAASNGKMYGGNAALMYEYDYLNTGAVIPTAYPQSYISYSGNMLEICRKPGYKYFYTDTFTVAENDPFSFNVHSDNAHTFNWKRNGVAITQTDSVLHFSNIAAGDSGIYTCEMTNQCGITETMPLVINVCRKPGYELFTRDTFTVCATDSFSFTIHNSDANAFAWKKNGLTISLTDSVLHFTNFTSTDSGIYTCQLTNDCGFIETMPVTLHYKDCTLTGINVNAQREVFSIFPNPATNEIELSAGAFHIESVHVINVMGQTLISTSTNRIKVSELPSGVYFITAETEKGLQRGKFIKE